MIIKEIMNYNEDFVQNRGYEQFQTTKFPNKKIVVLTCMDTRLGELLPKAMNLQNGDAKIVKTAGALVSHAFGSVMRSVLVGVYELNAEEVCVVGHHDCGMTGLQASIILEKAERHGVSKDTIETLTGAGINLSKWLTGFPMPEESVIHSVKKIKGHPLFPKDIPVHGLIMHPENGKLDWVINGYSAR